MRLRQGGENQFVYHVSQSFFSVLAIKATAPEWALEPLDIEPSKPNIKSPHPLAFVAVHRLRSCGLSSFTRNCEIKEYIITTSRINIYLKQLFCIPEKKEDRERSSVLIVVMSLGDINNG